MDKQSIPNKEMRENIVIQVQRAEGLIKALALRDKEHVALVGAGGKSTLLFALSGELKGINRKVLMSTTTKVWRREASEADSVWFSGCDESWREGLRKDLEGGKTVFLGLRTLENGKVQGVDRSVLDALYQEEDLDYLLVEADGSAGHPVKAPAQDEPVIPESTTSVLALMGVEALGKPLIPEIVFRVEPFERITRIAPGEIITSLPLSKIFVHPDGLFKSASAGARKVVLLNKADLAHDREGVRSLTRHILADCRMDVERVIVGSMRTGGWEVYTS